MYKDCLILEELIDKFKEYNRNKLNKEKEDKDREIVMNYKMFTITKEEVTKMKNDGTFKKLLWGTTVLFLELVAIPFLMVSKLAYVSQGVSHKYERFTTDDNQFNNKKFIPYVINELEKRYITDFILDDLETDYDEVKSRFDDEFSNLCTDYDYKTEEEITDAIITNLAQCGDPLHSYYILQTDLFIAKKLKDKVNPQVVKNITKKLSKVQPCNKYVEQYLLKNNNKFKGYSSKLVKRCKDNHSAEIKLVEKVLQEVK